ncbi:MAG: GAF domain-containing protein [Myxococcales bacterium]|nr:GAF domain-containing protein [Myxococcales bacterium]
MDELEDVGEPAIVICSSGFDVSPLAVALRPLLAVVEIVTPEGLAEVLATIPRGRPVLIVLDPELARAEGLAPGSLDSPSLRIVALPGTSARAWQPAAGGARIDLSLEIGFDALATVFGAALRGISQAARIAALSAEREHLAREVQKLNRIGIALSTERDPARLLEYILTTTREITGADAGSLYTTERTDDGAAVLRFTLAQNDSMTLPPLTQFAVPINTATLAGYVAATGEALNIPDAYAIDPGAPYSFNPSFDRETGYHTRSMLVLPMRNQLDQCIGVLQLINRKRWPGAPIRDPRADVVPFDEPSLELATSLASQAAVSLTNNQLYEGLERKIDELEQTQSQLVQSEKLASLGQLTAGVAHEINNPLAFSRNNTHLARERIGSTRRRLLVHAWLMGQDDPSGGDDPPLEVVLEALAGDPELAEDVSDLRTDLDPLADPGERAALLRSFMGYVEESRAAAEGSIDALLASVTTLLDESLMGLDRVAEIVLGLRNFARLDEASFQTADIDEGIRQTLMILREPAREARVALTADLGLTRPHPCFPAKLNQVVLNLVNNAIDACEPGGAVRVRSRESASTVEIAVHDDGHGISVSNMPKIFDPFFTTKPVGKGTGLGLSISYRIVREHHGTIVVEPNAPRGTVFRVQIPADLSAPADDA